MDPMMKSRLCRGYIMIPAKRNGTDIRARPIGIKSLSMTSSRLVLTSTVHVKATDRLHDWIIGLIYGFASILTVAVEMDDMVILSTRLDGRFGGRIASPVTAVEVFALCSSR